MPASEKTPISTAASTPALPAEERTRLRALALDVLQTEAAAIAALTERLDDAFVRACELMLTCTGRVVVVGMGKSGHIGGKIAATLASTGTPAFYVHPGEAGHGDLGMVVAGDVVLALSNSGETDEIVSLLPSLKRQGTALIALTGNPRSTLAQAAAAHVDVSVAAEACPLGLAPTASTTAALAMGDALAIALLEKRGFTSEDFARSHPGGTLGRRLLLHVRDIMHTGDAVPQVSQAAPFREALMEMTSKGLGMTTVTDESSRVLGVFTDGDLRRAFDHGIDLQATDIAHVMTPNCTTIGPDALAAEGLAIMQQRSINALPVVDDNDRLIGALNMHTLLRAGVV
ncbi:MAG: KpsF/GutQ family sugar-phosphate isomerase [Halofilum sp. (in: g-proteobacteria)]